MTRQLDLFGPSSPLVGITVNVEHFQDRCHENLARVHEGKGPHVGELRCVACGKHRGWLSRDTANWIATVINKFGAPSTPIVLRRRAQEFTPLRENPPGNAGTTQEKEHT
jgi:hypothetical protein